MKIALVFCEIDRLFDKYKAGVFSIFESNPPLGLAGIGTVAVNRGHEVKIFDQQLEKMTNDELVEKILEYKADIVGFSSTSLNIQNSLYCAEKIRDREKKLVFAGGIHVTLCTKKVLDSEVFDFLISGEGEEVFEKILIQLEKNKKVDNLNLEGVWLKGDLENRGTAVLETVDQLIVDRSIFNINKYKNKGALLTETPCYSIFSSRGCPFKCKFCSKPDYFKIYRQRNVENVISEIKHLIQNYGCKSISFREDNFTVDIERLKYFCQKMIDEFSGEFHWECESRADMPKDVLELMYRAGCRGIWCGVETVVPRWQKWIEKDLEKDKVIKFYDDCKEIGIKTGALFIFGFPNQTLEEIEEDIEFATSLPTEFSAFQCLAIFPGSPLLEYYKGSENLYYVTEDVALALIEGKTFKEMIEMEKNINMKIASSRLKYKQ